MRYLAAALVLVSAIGATGSTPVRHLVYDFTWGVSNTTEVHNSGMSQGGGGSPTGMNGGADASGISQQQSGTSDKGTIDVDVMGEQADKGLIVHISETAQGRRSAPPATCVVFGNTTIVCESDKKINAEELTLLRFLAGTFVDPNNLDSKQHWQVSQGDAHYTTTADYTITSNKDGIMTIDETRHVKDTSGARPLESEINTTIGYDFNRTIPTSVNEYSIARSEQAEQYITLKTQTVLTLKSDSLPAASPAP